jgi:hypothetical protein
MLSRNNLGLSESKFTTLPFMEGMCSSGFQDDIENTFRNIRSQPGPGVAIH